MNNSSTIRNIIIMMITVTSIFNANRIYAGSVMRRNAIRRSDSKSGIQLSNTNNTHNTNVSDSLPSGVTQDWLKSLKDENGNKIIPEDPGGDGLQSRIFNGLAPGSQFGNSISTAGDVNGDGFDDIIIGAQGYNSHTGRVYIYFGGPNMNTTADVTLNGAAANDYFGISVSSAGDVNGDGYYDVIVGANGHNSNTGAAYIYFGGAAMNNTADVTLTGEAANVDFGVSVSSAGDVNGDGYSDVIVGADGYSSAKGRAYIYFGGTAMNNIADVTMTGEVVNISFGYSVSSAGDVNGDGYPDVIVGAPGFNSSTGKAYIYFGGTAMNNVVDVTMIGEAANNNFGYSVSSAGNVNNDAYSDVIIGAYGYSSGKGRAYVYYGGAAMNNTPDVIMTGEVTGNAFGYCVSSAGDINGDGYSDVVTGSPNYNSSAGREYIYFGGAAMNNSPDVTITGEQAGSYFGYSASSAGDVNNDGYPDVIVGAFGYNSATGRVYLYDYYMSDEIIPDIAMNGESTSSYFGNAVSSAGDVNGDGYSDVIVGALGYGTTGRAYIFYGGPMMNNTPDVTMTGESGSSFGTSVSSAGDVNGDGYSDVVVGANGYNSATGRAYIYYGGSSMDNFADVTFTGEATFTYFGLSVSSAGDVNGDGYSDVIVGARGYSSSTGRTYIFYGGSVMNNIADVVMTGFSGDKFGGSVSTAGDVNGDGYSDVIVGANGNNSYTGCAYLFFGGVSMNNTPDLVFTGETVNDYFGTSVSSAGDVNGDGYSDVIVGTDDYSTYRGRAYIFYGGSRMNNTPDIILTGVASYYHFGSTVSSAGDVNGDGYSDVIIGAYGYSFGIGRVLIFFGGSPMDYSADVIMAGDASDIYFGTAVSSAGDINGDGYSDMIVGAGSYNSSTGSAFIYTGSDISVKPILMSVKDVPNDQGGNVNLKWARSGYDVNGNDLITDYLVYRSYPPSNGGYSWELVSTVPATKRSFYTFTDATPSDSSSGGSGTMFYQIMARTSQPSQYWLSGILSGRSIDNIAPLMVSPFTATSVANDVKLDWGASSSPDLLNYVIYRSTSSTINPESEPVFATTTSLTYLDTSPLSGLYYYFIVAQDIHNNKSPVAVVESPGIKLNLTMFIQGFYNASGNSQVSDTVKVELHYQTSPFSVADVTKAVAGTNGSAVMKFGNASGGNYYIALKHRNSIETWSASPVGMSNGSTTNYNFTNASSQAYGSNQKQVDTSPLRFAIYNGDVNQDGTVDLTDISNCYNDAGNFVTGYVKTDVNGDNLVDLTDISIAFNNSNNFVSRITP